MEDAAVFESVQSETVVEHMVCAGLCVLEMKEEYRCIIIYLSVRQIYTG